MPQNSSNAYPNSIPNPLTTIVPPDIITMAGQAAVTEYAKFHSAHIIKTQNAQFVSVVSDFLNNLNSSRSRLFDIISDNIKHHLKALEKSGMPLGHVLSRLCAIDLFISDMSKTESIRLSPLVHTELIYPVPPRLLVESSSNTVDYVGVYGDFLARHTNPQTRASYQDSLHRFFDYCWSTQIQDIKSVRGVTMAGFIAHCSEKDKTGLIDDKARTVSATMSTVRTLFDLYIVEGLMSINVVRAVKLPKTPSGKGTTPVLSNDLVARMIDMISLKTSADYRDHALIAIMAYSLFRISAVQSCELKTIKCAEIFAG